MPIIHDHKIIFIHIPKTGGTSIESCFNMKMLNKKNMYGTYNKQEFTHFTAKDIKASIDENIWKEYTKFTIIRNPYDKMISEWKRIVGNLKDEPNQFKNWLKKVRIPKDHKNKNTTHFTKQVDFVLEKNKEIVDKIFRFENYEEVTNFIKIKTNKIVPHANRSTHKHYSYYYDEEAKNILENLYKEDLDYFGYSFSQNP